MSRVFIDGFEHGHLGLWEAAGGGNATITSTGVIDGNYSALLTGIAKISKSLTTYNEIFVTGKFQFRINNSEVHIFDLDKGATRILSVGISVGNVIHLYRGATAIASATTGAISTNVNYLIEFHAKISTAGIGKVLLDGEPIINWTSNTKPGADDDFNTLKIGDTNAYDQDMLVDDIIIDSTAYPGNTKIMALVPNASGGSTQWTPSAGENYGCVDEIPPTTVENVSINTTGALDLYNISTLNSSAITIKCLQISALGEIEGTPDVPKVQIAIAHNSTSAFSSSLTPGSGGTPAYMTKLWEENPITTAAFSVSQISSLQIGLKAVTA